MEGVEQEDNGENKSKDEREENCDSDPLVYQLVRVEGDGTLVPATEDEVMQFEHLFDDGKVEDLPSVADVSKVESFLSDNVLSTNKSDLEGFFQSEDSVIDEQKLKNSLEDDNDPNKPDKTPPSRDISAETTQNSTVVNNAHASETEKADATSPPANVASSDNVSSVPDADTVGLKPNFSLLTKDEICLDGLSIRELQEVFLATFGRQTNVKDKSWLKRRIAMGLTNSCQVPTSNFIIKDKKIIAKEGGAQHEEAVLASSESLSLQESTKKRVRNSNSNLENSASPEDSSTSKRMRKPTKRYIEELSSLDSRDESIRLTSLVGRNNYDRPMRSRVRLPREVGSWQTAFRTRSDSLGGFRVQVPFTSRARRCRPRKNLIAFTANCLLGEDGNIVKEDESEKPMMDMRASNQKSTQLKNVDKKQGKENRDVTVAEPDEEPEMEPDNAQSEGENAHDSNHDECPSRLVAKGGNVRRKHHRAWTLCEVLKLVEGVARYGAGRWSEIRRLAFASYSYRTSVDLKDKWRNLLRASMAQPSAEKEGKHTRKPASLPIPTSILVRVRELAELHAQAGPEFPANKFTPVHGRKVVQGKGSGFL